MYISRKLGRKGQVVIPKDIREHLKLKTGSRVLFEVAAESIVITPLKGEEKFVEDFCSVVKKKLGKKIKLKELYYAQLEERNLI